ncbi:high mobility group B protein 14-like [Actinidia eriantha]|uniref:high mobility group B protein 14-like n=1 Tax=Actinidia eriantha TaxID=165200 RepID=UPI00258C8F8C|nr:high mobility group B protein 14-like [Actinidia eriantha]
MAKKASKSRKSVSVVSASASAENSTNGKMVLKVKSTGKMKKGTQQSRPKSASEPKTTPKWKAAKLDAKKPKKPPTAFFYFLEDFRKEFQEQNPGVKSMRDIGKACGEKWKTMTYEEKVQYYDVATEKRAGFDRAMVDYNRRMESGEDQENEDSEFDE